MPFELPMPSPKRLSVHAEWLGEAPTPSKQDNARVGKLLKDAPALRLVSGSVPTPTTWPKSIR